jgi:hypothetical protein
MWEEQRGVGIRRVVVLMMAKIVVSSAWRAGREVLL